MQAEASTVTPISATGDPCRHYCEIGLNQVCGALRAMSLLVGAGPNNATDEDIASILAIIADKAEDVRADVMRAGTFTSSEGTTVHYGQRDMKGMVAAYNAATAQAPIVVGHPLTDKPSYGWIDSLTLDGDYVLATPSEVAPAFAEQVRAGRYRKISAQFYPPHHKANPSPGYWHLKHVGFLGAAAPAVKGLGTVAFAEAVPLELEPLASFSAPAGYVSADVELYQRARTIQSENPGMSIIDAAMQAGRRK